MMIVEKVILSIKCLVKKREEESIRDVVVGGGGGDKGDDVIFLKGRSVVVEYCNGEVELPPAVEEDASVMILCCMIVCLIL